MILRVPVTASDIVEWVRLAANAINALIRAHDGIVSGRTPVAGVIFQPQPLPDDPVPGQTVFDEADDKLKTWDGTTWQACW